jgi:hypothetical protein
VLDLSKFEPKTEKLLLFTLWQLRLSLAWSKVWAESFWLRAPIYAKELPQTSKKTLEAFFLLFFMSLDILMLNWIVNNNFFFHLEVYNMNISYGYIFGKGREKLVVECNKSYITLKKELEVTLL